MTQDNQPKDIVTVMRLMPLHRSDATRQESAIVASFQSAWVRTEGDAVFLVVRNDCSLGGFKVGDIVHWVAEPFGVVWRAEYAADAAGQPFTMSVERCLTSEPPSAEDQQCGD